MTVKLLVAVSESEETDFAVREIARRPWPAGTRARVISVMTQDPAAAPQGVPVPSAPLSEVPPWPAGTLRTRAVLDAQTREIAEASAAVLSAAGLITEVVVRDGTPGSEIIEEARTWRADLIILGSRQRGPVSRFLLGSVASYVLNHSPCSIEVVREPHFD
jgi:nucleotide-binding universal stress UspA family protein